MYLMPGARSLWTLDPCPIVWRFAARQIWDKKAYPDYLKRIYDDELQYLLDPSPRQNSS